MDQTGGVDRPETLGGLDVGRHHVAPRGALALPGPKGDPVDELHGHVDAGALTFEFVHPGLEYGDHIGVVDLRHRARYEEHAGAGSVGVALVTPQMQKFDRNRPIEFGVMGGVDRAHGARTQQLSEPDAPDPPRHRGTKHRRPGPRPRLLGTDDGEGLRQAGDPERFGSRRGPRRRVLFVVVHRVGWASIPPRSAPKRWQRHRPKSSVMDNVLRRLIGSRFRR